MQLGDIKLEISNLRNEMKELIDEVKKGNSPIVVGNAAVFVVFFGNVRCFPSGNVLEVMRNGHVM